MPREPWLEEISRDGIRLVTGGGAGAAGLVVAFSDRLGGVSPAPFDTLNLSVSVGDEAGRVLANRERVAAAAGLPATDPVLLRQVHGNEVVDAAEAAGEGPLRSGDALVTGARGRPVGVLTADCVPVVVASSTRVAVVHAGWRGLVGGVIANAVAAVPGARWAWVGPSIRACCYEVGPEVAAAFGAAGLPVASGRSVDPGRAAVVALRAAGIGSIAASDECTSCDPRYFSFRRDGLTGRQGGFACLLP